MTSICVADLVNILQNVPEDYEVIVNIEEKTIGIIGGIEINDDWKEVRLLL